MADLVIDSIRAAIAQGKLIDLAEDYRTSRSIRACLPRQTDYPFAISTTAFNQEVQQGTPRQRQSRLDIIGAFLTKVLALGEKRRPADLELRFPGEASESSVGALKLTWFAPNKYWVILLPNEQLQSTLKVT